MHYFLLHEAERFQTVVRPVLSAAHREHSFTPARELCRELAPAAAGFIQHSSPGMTEPVLLRIAAGAALPFQRDLWRLLAGEVLLFAAVEAPEIEVPLETYLQVLKQLPSDVRAEFAPIQRAILGGRDLVFGGAYYRPDDAGWNDRTDVRELAVELAEVRPEEWTLADEDELAFAREWFPALADMYSRAAERDFAVVCERL